MCLRGLRRLVGLWWSPCVCPGCFVDLSYLQSFIIFCESNIFFCALQQYYKLFSPPSPPPSRIPDAKKTTQGRRKDKTKQEGIMWLLAACLRAVVACVVVCCCMFVRMGAVLPRTMGRPMRRKPLSQSQSETCLHLDGEGEV